MDRLKTHEIIFNLPVQGFELSNETKRAIETLNNAVKPIAEYSERMPKIPEPMARLCQLVMQLDFPIIKNSDSRQVREIQAEQKKQHEELISSISQSINRSNTSSIKTQKHDTTILLERIKKLEEEGKAKDIEIERLREQHKTNKTLEKCLELKRLLLLIKEHPEYSIQQIAGVLCKSEKTIKIQLKEICEKIYNIPEQEKNKGLKRVIKLIQTSSFL